MSLERPVQAPISRWVGVTVLTGAGLSLTPFLFLALHAFPSADDYCLAVESRGGFWAMQAFFYTQWTGRYSAMFAQALLSQWDLATIYPWFCVATIGATLLAARAAILPLLGRGTSSRSGWAAAVVITAVFSGNLPSSAEAYMWMSSAISYQWGLVALLYWASLLLRLTRDADASWAITGAACVLGALIPGLNEVMLPIVVAVLAALFVFRADRRPSMAVVLLLCVVTAAAIAVTLLAPGNAVRSATYPEIPSRHNLGFAVFETLRQTTRFIATHVSAAAVWVAAFAAWWWGPSGACHAMTRMSARRSVVLVLAALGLVYATLFPLYWEYGAVNYTGEGRTYNVTFSVFALAMIIGLWGVLSGVESAFGTPDGPIRRRHVDWIVAVCLVVSMLSSPATLEAFRTAAAAPAYLAAQQAREAVLATSGNRGRHVTVPRVPKAPGLAWGDLHADPDHWINRCTAAYYGVASVGTH